MHFHWLELLCGLLFVWRYTCTFTGLSCSVDYCLCEDTHALSLAWAALWTIVCVKIHMHFHWLELLCGLLFVWRYTCTFTGLSCSVDYCLCEDTHALSLAWAALWTIVCVKIHMHFHWLELLCGLLFVWRYTCTFTGLSCSVDYCLCEDTHALFIL